MSTQSAPLTETVEASVEATPASVPKEKKQISEAKAMSLAKAREGKRQKALLKKEKEMEGVLSSKSPPAAEQTVSQDDNDDADDEIDFDQILHALDNTQSSKKIDQIFSLVEELKEMKLKAKEKKKLKKREEKVTTTVIQTPKLNPKAVKAKETIKAIALTD